VKFLAALFYALAIAGGRGDVLDHLAVGILVFLGVVCTLLAIERIVQDAVRPVRSAWKAPGWFDRWNDEGPPADLMRPQTREEWAADLLNHAWPPRHFEEKS
jgi:hypothetical protein